MDTDRAVAHDELTVTRRSPEEIRLDPAHEYEGDDYFQKSIDRGLGLPEQIGGHIYQPPPVKHGTRIRGRIGAPIAALVFGLLIAAFVLFNLWSAGEFDSRIGGVLLLWGAGFSTVVWLLVRTP